MHFTDKQTEVHELNELSQRSKSCSVAKQGFEFSSLASNPVLLRT